MKTILVLALLALFAAPALADTPTTTTVTWTGVSGIENIATTFGDDAHSLVNFQGVNLNGNLWTTDSNDNPYTYGIDSIQNKISANFGADDYLSTLQVTVTKDQNYQGGPNYGPAGQEAMSYVGTTGSGYLGMNTVANYAEMTDNNYNQAPIPGFNGWQLSATGDGDTQYNLIHSIKIGNGDSASVQLYTPSGESGTGKIYYMADNLYGDAFRFGQGIPPAETAASATGSGVFNLNADASNFLKTTDSHFANGVVPGDGTPLSAQYNVNIVFSGAPTDNPFVYTDFRVSGNTNSMMAP
jgi:hypothetical protein